MMPSPLVVFVYFSTEIHLRSEQHTSKKAMPGWQTTTHVIGGGFLFINFMMRFAQSAEDGTMPLLHCMAAPDAQPGAIYEPGGITALAGPPVKKALEPMCRTAEAKRILWEESAKAVGDFAV